MEKFYEETMISFEQIYMDARIRMHLEKMPRYNGVEKEDADTVLRESLKLNGMLEPIKVRMMKKNKFLLLDGWRRLRCHQALFPDMRIRALVKVSEDCQRNGIEDTVTEQDLCEAATYNLVREKVPVRIVEGIVARLHEKNWGYERIAKAIGYSKAGVQKIVNRLKNSDSENTKNPAIKMSIREIKRTRTMLQNVVAVFKENLPEKVAGALHVVDKFLAEQEMCNQQKGDIKSNETENHSVTPNSSALNSISKEEHDDE